MTEAEIKQVASTAAHEALEKFLLVLGVNVSTPADKIELQKDFAHVRSERITVGAIRKQIYTGIASAVIAGLATVIGFYFSRGGH